ncbi:hypothetical protein BAUCODRAFT_544122 [Baudoinia panamericana UAMH 10762]|uniref:AMP-dependent synthetase/ligase domain-containing protein n=1 Tax=Baudoinia panamericana (strain UAMH 10762) TaxID=717646 RepID=M2MS28_BAUPA|nr:uncharacterized protein BAUCODRAFT_544122 [Baudoinia panamericana UAMH 10762]EMC94308.1 hypothetical protein BAUCODRAFT_544122 [Baudoinia panamericana UAMH 10762]
MPTTSSFPSFDVPNVDIWQFIFETPREGNFPESQVIYRAVDDSRHYTFAQVRRTAELLGAALHNQYHIGKGDVVCVYSPNDVDYGPVVYGALWAGGIIAPANPGYGAKDLAFMLTNSGAKVIVTQKPLLEVARAAAELAKLSDDCIILMGDYTGLSNSKPPHFKSLVKSDSTSQRPARLDPHNDLAFLAYSSGTTGLPKGVMLSHRNIIADVLGIRGCVGSENYGWKNDRILAILPFFHIYGLTGLLHQPLHRGLEIVVMPAFNLNEFCTAVQRYKITFTYVAPPVLVQLSRGREVKKYDLSSLRMITSGAAPLTKELVAFLHDKMGLKVNQAYGLSETSPMTHTQPWSEWWSSVGSVGKLFPNMSAKLVSGDGREVQAGETGELWVKGPNVFKGYWKNAEATKNAITEDGYFKTGDVGHQDDNHNLYITDRMKELIKWNGFQVAPAELEGILLDSPLVDDVAVIGIHDAAEHTELPRAYVVPASGREPSEALGREIAEWMSARVAYYKKLRGGVRFVKEIPKSQAGKILRRVLKDMATEEERQGRAKL